MECVCLDDSLSTSLHRGGLVASGVCVWMIVSVQVFTGVDWWRVECVCLDDSLSTSLHRGGLVASGVCVCG